MSALTARDRDAVEQFRNFLSWGVDPASPARPVPPAWFAYAFGVSAYCPPVGEW